jgi:tyrosyl-tRNA synthetase
LLSVDEQFEIIKRRTVDLTPEDLLREKLARSIKNEEPLLVKQGFDPTAPDLHIGHTVGLRKLREFQDLGHKVAFLIGDFTGLIGDPTGRSETRKRMDRDELISNAKTYTEQAFKILTPAMTIIDYNSRWLSKLNFPEVLELASTQTIARLIEREDFQKRFNEQRPISLLEFLYPLAQGYDSVALHADVEIGATEQKFNLLMARDIQKAYGQEPQVILTMPVLEGIDGVEKMSKSLNNYIGISEAPEEMFGKTMRIPDTLILKYFELATTRSPEELKAIEKRLADPEVNPSHLKRELARDLITQYHGEDKADPAESHFNTIHVDHHAPTDMAKLSLAGEDGRLWIVKALTEAGLCKSASEARRMIQQGAISVDGEKVTDIECRLEERKKEYVLKVGKRRFLELTVK